MDPDLFVFIDFQILAFLLLFVLNVYRLCSINWKLLHIKYFRSCKYLAVNFVLVLNMLVILQKLPLSWKHGVAFSLYPIGHTLLIFYDYNDMFFPMFYISILNFWQWTI